MNRQEFFKEALRLVLSKGEPSKDQKKWRPPGAHPSENRFQQLCTGCDACMIACPINVILIDNLEKRDPFLPNKSLCIQCPGHPCTDACPTGALKAEYGFFLRSL